ncbi:MAG TPA: cobyric acid synthase [Ignavibacteriales bacterium]|nr:cobyric acid synthase [Ignavibacteriales bacterium]
MKMQDLMIQGTASSVGKSLITAGLCRIFYQEGFKVAPFKSQNMSLNSYATFEGLEIGRAQALQAMAAKVPPSVLMNPILLKPNAENNSQVILLGKPYGNLDAHNYYSIKKKLKDIVIETYHKLKNEFEIIIIEGAGSPAEINLNKDDFVNMGMADIANANVLLVGDIDKGGVFASIYGTIKLLENRHQERIKGLIINKFRGDKNLLKDGLIQIEELVNKPVLGVIPYFKLLLDDEDSANEFKRKYNKFKNDKINISVILLPHISNFTDFDPFYLDDDVILNYIDVPEKIQKSDIIILPGTKNTIEDLRWLKKNKFDIAIKNFNGMIWGICGGFQMLGKFIIDKYGVESMKGDKEEALNLLNLETYLEKGKVTQLVTGTALYEKIYGYEIHAGISKAEGLPFATIQLLNDDSKIWNDGLIYKDDNKTVFGTYIHGIFDSGNFRAKILNIIRDKKKLLQRPAEDLYLRREKELDKLADILRQNLNINFIKKITLR